MDFCCDRQSSRESRRAFSKFALAALLSSLILLIAVRQPAAWTHGRFLDEEASVFLAFAWNSTPAEALFRPFAGYWNLAANGSTLVLAEAIRGGLLSMEHAPYSTMALGLLFQLLPIVLVLTARSPWLDHRGVRLASALLIAVAPGTEEVGFNVIHIQFHLALTAALVLAADVPTSRTAAAFHALPLFLAPLCGPIAILLLPLFLARAWLERDKARAWQAGVLGAAALVQLGLFAGASQMRGVRTDMLTVIVGTGLRLIMFPLLGAGLTQGVADWLYAGRSPELGWKLVIAGTTLLAFGTLLVAAIRRRSATSWLLVAGVLIAVASFGFGMASHSQFYVLLPTVGPRYHFIPLVLIGIALFATIREVGGFQRSLFVAFSGMWLATAVVGHVQSALRGPQGPPWPAEVAAWRLDPERPLGVWPEPMAADLSGHLQICRPPSDPLGDPKAPRYCESGWMASFYAGISRRKKP